MIETQISKRMRSCDISQFAMRRLDRPNEHYERSHPRGDESDQLGRTTEYIVQTKTVIFSSSFRHGSLQSIERFCVDRFRNSIQRYHATHHALQFWECMMDYIIRDQNYSSTYTLINITVEYVVDLVHLEIIIGLICLLLRLNVFP